MSRIMLLAAVFAFASAMPEPNLFEDIVTAELRKLLTPYDPHTFTGVHTLNVTHDDTSLHFTFDELTFTGLADIECTHFSPPVLTKEVTITTQHLKVDIHSPSYTVEGHLNGQPLSASGVADLTAHTFGGTANFHADSHSLSPFSICIAPGTLQLDLFVESLDANFENAEELNHEIDTRGPELVDLLEADLLVHEDAIVDFLNHLLCKV
ncbi:uncharacterized protein LOC135210932 [Macrobrachium nipponense]|uniref:uncharacterized protein LOC135210932 n=1 Tax=Macrobrachium nipponense TaxID=159736 RepID=UPI0030C817B6